MKRKIRIAIYLCGLLTFVLPLYAFSAEPASLTLEKAVQMALVNDIQVAIARNNLTKTKLSMEQEVLKYYPQTNLNDSLGHDYNNGSNQNVVTLTITESIPTNTNLYGNKIPTDLEVAFWDRVSSEGALRIAEANVRYNTISLYMSALKAQQTLAYQEKILSNAETAAELAREKLKQGKITRPDLLKAENDLLNAQFDMEKDRSDLRLALRQLGNQIGEKNPETLQLCDVTSVTPNFDFATLKQSTLQKRMEIQQEEINVRKSKRSLAQAFNQTLPGLDLSYNYSNRETGYKVSYDFLTGAISGAIETRNTQDSNLIDSRDDKYLYGIKNNLKLEFTWTFDFGIKGKKLKQARLDLDNTQKSLEQKQQNIEWELEQAIANYQLAAEKVTLNRQTLPYYQKRLDLKRLEYQLGSATLAEVNLVEQEWLQAKQQVDFALYERELAYYKLKLVCGELYESY